MNDQPANDIQIPAAIPIIGKKPERVRPILRHPKLKDFSLAIADGEIRQILQRLDDFRLPLSTQERALIGRNLSLILGGLMAYSEVLFTELEAVKQAAEAPKN